MVLEKTLDRFCNLAAISSSSFDEPWGGEYQRDPSRQDFKSYPSTSSIPCPADVFVFLERPRSFVHDHGC